MCTLRNTLNLFYVAAILNFQFQNGRKEKWINVKSARIFLEFSSLAAVRDPRTNLCSTPRNM